jgi:hypothetical protein
MALGHPRDCVGRKFNFAIRGLIAAGVLGIVAVLYRAKATDYERLRR